MQGGRGRLFVEDDPRAEVLLLQRWGLEGAMSIGANGLGSWESEKGEA